MSFFNHIFRPQNRLNIPSRAVHLVRSSIDFESQLQDAGNKLVVVEFFANWCGICRLMAPKFEVLAKQYENKMIAMKIDVEELADVALRYDFVELPTFILFKNKAKILCFTGSNEMSLENLIKENTK